MRDHGTAAAWGEDDEGEVVGVSGDIESDNDLDEAAQAWADAEAESEAELARYGVPLYTILRRSHAQSEVIGVEESLDHIDELFTESAMLTSGPTAEPSGHLEPEGQAVSGDLFDGDGDGDGDEGVGDGITPRKVAYQLEYPDVFTWYENWFRHAYRRRIDGRQRRWSGSWYTNLEALTRMESLWRAWEAARQDPEVGGSLWFLTHADEHMRVLMDPDGPFAHLSTEQVDKTSSAQPLAWVPPATAAAS